MCLTFWALNEMFPIIWALTHWSPAALMKRLLEARPGHVKRTTSLWFGGDSFRLSPLIPDEPPASRLCGPCMNARHCPLPSPLSTTAEKTACLWPVPQTPQQLHCHWPESLSNVNGSMEAGELFSPRVHTMGLGWAESQKHNNKSADALRCEGGLWMKLGASPGRHSPVKTGCPPAVECLILGLSRSANPKSWKKENALLQVQKDWITGESRQKKSISWKNSNGPRLGLLIFTLKMNRQHNVIL